MITITSKKEGFRRCGIAHSQTPTSYPDDQFSAEELQALKEESMLVVTVEAEDTKGGKAKNAPDGGKA